MGGPFPASAGAASYRNTAIYHQICHDLADPSSLRLGGPPPAATFYLNALSDAAINTRSATIFCDTFIIVYR